MERTLFLNGTIAEESWFDDDVTPQLFKDELLSGSGDITVWINSPGGDCVAAAQIYNMLMDYKGNVTVKIDGIAASAASVIAMAGTKVLVSPVSMMMIHNPMTVAFGNTGEMEKAIAMLDEVKEVEVQKIINKIALIQASPLYFGNRETFWLVNEGFDLQRDDISKVALHVDYIDYDNPEKNIFKVVNQYSVQGERLRRPDLLVFVNGRLHRRLG